MFTKYLSAISVSIWGGFRKELPEINNIRNLTLKRIALTERVRQNEYYFLA